MTHPFDALITVADLDVEIAALERSRATLPARKALEELAEVASAQERTQQILDAERLPLLATLKSLEEEAARLATRERDVRSKLSASTGAGRDLAAMDAEAQRLVAMRVELEDQELTIMESLEPLEAKGIANSAAAANTLSARNELLVVLGAEDEALNAQIEERRSKRGEIATTLDAPLLTRYETLSSGLGGVGATRLSNGQCGGCHLSLSSVELDQMRKMAIEEIAICEQCSRMLLRTEQLG
jgi:predicted  nucleic acid-binding Zn-ribbon protein